MIYATAYEISQVFSPIMEVFREMSKRGGFRVLFLVRGF